MIKFGICTESRLRRETDIARRSALVSYLLLDLPESPSPRDIWRFETIMRYVRLSSGSFRTTFPERFRDLDPRINDVLKTHFDRHQPLDVHDWAASDLITSVEWAENLSLYFPEATLTASDRTLFLFLAASPNASSYILEPDGTPLQCVRPPFVVSFLYRDTPLFLVNNLLRRMVSSRLPALSAIVTLPQCRALEGADTYREGRWSIRKLWLLHPSAIRYRASAGGRFRFMEHSVFSSLPTPADVIRTMNIYNPESFGPQTLLGGIRSVYASLKHGGIWIVGRTAECYDPDPNVTIFLKTSTGFRPIQQFGTGTELNGLIAHGDYALLQPES